MEESKVVVIFSNFLFKLRSLRFEEIEVERDAMDIVFYVSVVGSLMYVMVGLRLDLGYVIGVVSRFMVNFGRSYWEVVKWILRYLNGVLNVCLTFIKIKEFDIEGFLDSDYFADLDKRRLVLVYVFRVGGNTVSWRLCL